MIILIITRFIVLRESVLLFGLGDEYHNNLGVSDLESPIPCIQSYVAIKQ